MEIEKKELTEEQKKKVEKLFKRYVLDWFLATFLYFGFMFFANLTIVYIDTIYLHDTPTRTFIVLGSGIITYMGLLSTMREKRDILVVKIKEITENT